MRAESNAAVAGDGTIVQDAMPATAQITPELFRRFQRLVYQDTGIWLGESKTALLCGRLARRLRALELKSLKQYFDLVNRPESAGERVLMIDAITTNETHFFREPRHFDFLRQTAIPRWRTEETSGARRKQIRIWSAACSTGEEPYSLAAVLLSELPEWDMQVVATDISTKVLEAAEEGVYRIERASTIPADLLRRYFLKGIAAKEGTFKVAPELRRTVSFARLNLTRIPGSFPQFDVIFCRNVLIYFDAESKRTTVESMIDHLSPDGLLFIGHSENLNGVTRRARTLAPTIYARCE
jgi:chemotaxis protein methyltransferase CheR